MKARIASLWLLGIGWSLPSFAAPADGRIILPTNVAPTHYEIAIAPDAANLTFTGTVTIDFDIKEQTRDITLNVADLTFSRVVLSGETTSPAIALDDRNQTATFTFPKPIAPGQRKLTIDYAGKIFEQASGLFALDYTAGKDKKRALFTQFENSDARRFVPCWDEPNRKATFTLTVTVPAGDFPVSNMPIASSAQLAGGLKRVQFARSPKMSSYLLFFSTGDMERIARKVGKIDLGVVVKRGDRERAAFALEAAAKVLPYYEEYFATPYPLPKLDLVAGPGSSQFFGAMENWGAIFYFESIILVDPKTSTEGDKREIYLTVAHEIAHMWFGDLVTMDWWDDLWLNEGFATWMEFKATDRFHPEWNVMLDALGRTDFAMGRDARVGTHPVIQPIRDVLQASQAFDSITYRKGAAIIRMLEEYVGADAFRAGVRNYIAAHLYANAVTDDLWRELDKVSPAPITSIAHGFTRQDGVPLIRVKGHGANIRLEQDRFALDESGKAQLSWAVPVITRELDRTAEWRGIVTRGRPIDVSHSASSAIIVNAGRSGYYRTQYDHALFDTLAARFASLSSIDQLGLLYDTRMLGYSGDSPLSGLLGLAERANPTMHPRVQATVAERLGAIDFFYRGLASRKTYRAFGRQVLRPLFAEVGWDPGPGESENVPQLRQSLILNLADFGDAAILSEAKRLFAGYAADPESLSGEKRRAVLRIAAQHADAATWEEIHKLATAAESVVEKARYYAYLGAALDKALAKRALALTLTSEVEPPTRPHIIAAVANEHPELAFDFVLAHRDLVMGWIEPSSRESYVPELLSSSMNPAYLDRLRAYADKHIPATARRAAEVTAGEMAFNIMVREKRLTEVDRWLMSRGF